MNELTAVSVGQVECPFCAELVKSAAKKCRHCGETLDPAMRKAEEAMRLASASDRQIQNVNVNTNVSDGYRGKPQGSWIVLIFWIIVFFPIAILYFLMRRWW